MYVSFVYTYVGMFVCIGSQRATKRPPSVLHAYILCITPVVSLALAACVCKSSFPGHYLLPDIKKKLKSQSCSATISQKFSLYKFFSLLIEVNILRH